MVSPPCFGTTLPSSGSVPSDLWQMFSWGTVGRILWMGVLCLVTWCVAICCIPRCLGRAVAKALGLRMWINTASQLNRSFIQEKLHWVSLLLDLAWHTDSSSEAIKQWSTSARHQSLTHVSVQKVLKMPLAITPRHADQVKTSPRHWTITVKIKTLITNRPCTKVAFRLVAYSLFYKDMQHLPRRTPI
jgi:hypothetical protein